MWISPTLTVQWPEYFRPDAEDDAKIVDTTVKAHDAGLITKRAAVQKIQRTFGIENVDQFLAALDEEAKEKAKNAPPPPIGNAPNASGAPTNEPNANPANEEESTP